MLITVNPTANETPDAILGGAAVTSISNTGHGSTSTSAAGGGSTVKSARWFTFTAVAGQKLSIVLKIDHTSSGLLAGPSPSNQFTLEYSLNGGGAWLPAAARSDFTDAEGPTTFSTNLSVTQDISQVQVRVLYQADTTDPTDTAGVVATIANITLEVTTQDGPVITLM